ncbi:MAG: GNAT family N-acetyltransferase [Methyloligellaceae bacterium]
MELVDGLTDITPGKLATIVTSLQMFEAPELPDFKTAFTASLAKISHPDIDWYLRLYRRVGEDWLWFSRLQENPSKLESIIRNPSVEIFSLTVGDEEKGLLELDFRTNRECELAFLGITQDLQGRGFGSQLLNYGIKQAWSKPINRLWVHTCTLDHPRALVLYQQAGFVPFKIQLEVLDDPRLNGTIPKAAAPHVPLIEQ